MLASARELDSRLKRISRRGLLTARAARGASTAALVDAVASAQSEAAYEALSAVPRILAEQGIDADADVEARVRSLTYTASDGRSLDGLMGFAQTATVAPKQFDLIVLTQIADTARAASLLGSVTRPAVTGYVRMLEQPSCSRCVILAGKFFRHNKGFQRHPRCDCRHIPSTENVAGDVTTDPQAYFDSLPRIEQDRVFTQAGAEAVREGADIGQVVNARKGMSTAQSVSGRRRLVRRDAFGRPVYTTSVNAKRGQVRLMPESIVELAGNDRGELLRLLKAHGYIQ